MVVMVPLGHVGNDDAVAGLEALGDLDAIVGRTTQNDLDALRFLAIRGDAVDGKGSIGVSLERPLDESGTWNFFGVDGTTCG